MKNMQPPVEQVSCLVAQSMCVYYPSNVHGAGEQSSVCCNNRCALPLVRPANILVPLFLPCTLTCCSSLSCT